MAKPKKPEKPERVCALRGQQDSSSRSLVDGVCVSRGHSHVSRGRAAQLVDDNQAEWVAGVGAAIRMLKARHWRAAPSFAGSAVYSVMQLVR